MNTNQFKKCKVVMSKSDKPTNIIVEKYHGSTFKYLPFKIDVHLTPYEHYQHLYILSKERITKGDYFVYLNDNEIKDIFQAEWVGISNKKPYPLASGTEIIYPYGYNEGRENQAFIDKTPYSCNFYRQDCEDTYKIIASTDPKLNLPKPTKGFIKKYVELNGKITDVLVEYICGNTYLDENNLGELTYVEFPKVNKNSEITIRGVKEVKKVYTDVPVGAIADLITITKLSQDRNYIGDFDCIKKVDNWLKENNIN